MNIIASVVSIFGALLIIGLIIMVHELGHFWVGRACKIKIVEFGIGFGPKIKKWVKNDIIYSVRWILLGGFTKFYGEDQEVSDKLAFNNQPAGRRALTIAAGPMFNIIFALLLVVIVLCAFGDAAPAVGFVVPDSPAEAAGLQTGDRILSMNGVDMDFSMELEAAFRAADNVMMPITVLRDGQEISLEVPYRLYENHQYFNEAANRIDTLDGYKTGFTLSGQRVTFGFFEAIGLAFKFMFLLVRETVLAIFGLFAPRGTENVVGVVGMVGVIADALRSSIEYVLRLGVAISVSLAVFNLLPLPALDGGRLVFIGIEKLFRRPVPRNVEGVIHLIGFALFIVLFFFITYGDIKKLFGG